VFKARQKRIDAGGSLLLTDVARNELVNIAALHPQVLNFACAADLVSQAGGLLAVDVLEAKLNFELHIRNRHFCLRRLCTRFAAAEWQRNTERLQTAAALAGIFKTHRFAHGKNHFLVSRQPLMAA
jgi:hypothetical protein